MEETGDGLVIVGGREVGTVDVNRWEVREMLFGLALEVKEGGTVGDFIAGWSEVGHIWSSG